MKQIPNLTPRHLAAALRAGVAATAALALAACFEMDQDVSLSKDGSGTIEMKTVFGAQIAPMLEMGAAEGGGNPLEDLKDAAKMAEQAANMGEGVEFVEARDLEFNDGRKGVAATFRFADINNLRINLNESPGDEEEDTAPANLTFQFTPGDTSKLVIQMPPMEAGDAPAQAAEAAEGMDEAAMAMMAPMMQGMRVGMSITVDGEIVNTNASHTEGNKIILMDMDMGKLVANADAMKKLGSPDALQDFSQFATVAKEAGLKVETEQNIEVEFK